MSPAFIHEHLATAPFVPLSLHLADGRFFHVDHIDFVALTPGTRTLAVHSESGRVAHLDIDHIISLETLATEPRA